MAKEFKSTNELIEILNSKGVSIKDENNVRYLIEKYSYYSIVNSYKWIFKIIIEGKHEPKTKYKQ